MRRTDPCPPPPDHTPQAEDKAGPGTSFYRGRENEIVPLDVDVFPGAGALRREERQLCSALRVVPAQYLAIKAALLVHAYEHGGRLSLGEARRLFACDRLKLERIHALLAAAGLVQAEGT